MRKCTARIFIFSGRPDPTWIVEADQSQQLYSIWNKLEPSVNPNSSPIEPGLGYRGVSIWYESGEEFYAFDGYIMKKVGDVTEWRIDEGRVYERILFSSMPKGSIPEGIINF